MANFNPLVFSTSSFYSLTVITQHIMQKKRASNGAIRGWSFHRHPTLACKSGGVITCASHDLCFFYHDARIDVVLF